MSERAGTGFQALFGSGTGATAAFNTLRQLFFAMFLTDVVGLDGRVGSLVAVVGLAWDLAVVPRIGAWSDRAHTRWGRRRPFLLFGAVPAGLAFLLLWWAPPWASPAARLGHLALVWVLAHTAQALVNVPYLALIPEVAPAYDDRTSLTGWRTVFGLGASLAVAVAGPMLLDAALARGLGRAAGFAAVGAVFGAISVVPWLAIGATVRERPALDEARPSGALAALRDAWRNDAFRRAGAVYALTWTAFELAALMMPFFIAYRVCEGDLLATVTVFGASLPTESALLGVLLISALPAVPLWTWLARTLDKRVAYIAGIAFWAATLVGLALVPAGRVDLAALLAALAGMGIATAHVLPDAMLPDTVDYGEWQTGTRAEGTYYAAQDLLRKLASATALFVALQGLGWAGYAPPPEGATAYVPVPSAMTAIAALTGPVGAALLALAIVAAWGYPLSRERHAQIREDLERRSINGR